MDVGSWLRSLGLGQYEANFRDNKIDADLLPRLTVDDLKDIGVSVVGDRRRLLAAIPALSGPTPSVNAPASPPKPAPAGDLQISAERRPITVMFCDLVGSTSLAAKLDAEDWRNLVNAYLDATSAAVTDLGGHVLKRLGDGLMALFGYPQAQENDAERAVRAALAIQRALGEINARNASKGTPALSARIGIESGAVVVEAGGEVFGDAPNIAARVQAEAEPGSVLITLNVQRQVAGLFVAEEHSARELKGVPQPVQLFRIVRASGGGRRGGARALTPLVGREEDLDHLSRRWERARKGEGQLALVIGEPGIGKSRLIDEFHARLAETPHTWVEWSASQLLQNTPLHPITEWGRLRFRPDTPAEERLADLESTLRLIGLDPAEYAPLLAPLVDIPLPPASVANFPPEELRRRQLAAMTAWVLAGARSQPVVLFFEDLHWADPTSLDLLRAFADRGAQVPMLLLATTRPEFRPDWSVRSHHSLISLSPLDRAQVAHMVSEISARHALSKEVIEGVSDRTGGVPLFVEEITRLLLERGEQGGVQAIPPTLQQSLAARLDRLGPAREVAQIGAVLGRDFVYALLRDVAEIDEPPLQASLDRLADADLLFVEGAPPEARYRFKHALIQDAAYEGLLKSRRQALHRRAAQVLRDAEAEPEAIAHHFTEAGLDDLAIEWWGKAGDQALRRSAFKEAIAHLGKAIAMADKASERQAGVVDGDTARRAPGGSAAPNRRLSQLHVAYGNALFAARGPGVPETTQAFARAHEAAPGDKDAPERLAADYGLWIGSYVRGELPEMRAHAAAFLSDVEARPDSPEAGVAYRLAGITYWFAGEYREARDHLERALALFQPGRDDELTFRFGLDPGVAVMVNLANASWPLGEVDCAISLIDRMEARLADFTHGGLLAFGRMYSALFDLMRGDHARARPKAFELARLAREHELTMYGAFGAFLEGWVTAASGAVGGGLADMRRGVELLRDQNVRHFDGLVKIALAEAEARAGDPARAIAILDDALATCDRMGNRAFEAELHRTRGEILVRRDPGIPAPAEEAFLTAIAVAKQQGTRSFELRAALALVKMYQSTGRPVDAHAVLAPALEGFVPTSQMPEFAEAQALLAALAEMEEVKFAADSRRQRVHLQTSYGKALIGVHGYGAPETALAFEQARELATGLQAAGLDDSIDRFPAIYGVWVGTHVRGELLSMRELAATFLRECASRPNSGEASVGHRIMGATHWFAAEFVEARAHLEQAVAIFDPLRDADLAFRYGQDIGVSALGYSAIALWPLGEIGLSRRRADDAVTRTRSSGHVATVAYGLALSALYRLLIRDPEGAQPIAAQLGKVAEDLQSSQYLAFYDVLGGWPAWRSGSGESALLRIRRGIAQLKGQGMRTWAPLAEAMLAEVESEAGDSDCAMVTIGRTIAEAERLGQRWYDAELHRIRGEILLKQDPAAPAAAEEAYLTAIGIAQQQKARSFVLRAALPLAKLYPVTSGLADAHTVLAPALKGFSPTPEMPEIAEAQALLAALAEREEVKAAEAQREQRLQLHTAYSQAMMWSKGYAAGETKAALARAAELAERTDDFSRRFTALAGQFAAACTKGELRSARQLALTLLREAEDAGRVTEAGMANWMLGLIAYWHGDFVEARARCERALDARDRNPDPNVWGWDDAPTALSFLAATMWQLGEVESARELINSATQRASETGHGEVIVDTLFWKSYLEIWRGDPSATLSAANALGRVARERAMMQYVSEAELHLGWAQGRINDPIAGAAQVRRVLTAFVEQGVRVNLGFYSGLLAELEAESLGADSALARIDEALRLSDEVEHRCSLPFLHRLRGEILLKRDPPDTALAEEAFVASIAIAKEQGARSPVLLASLSLAKLYQSTARPVEAYAVLAPALEGFSPTPEMPEIAEAQAVLAAIEADAHVRHE